MFSEDNILDYCNLCKKCDEVKKCPVKAADFRRQIASTFIPLSALKSMETDGSALFEHVEKGMVTIQSLSEDLNKLIEFVFNQGTGI